MLISLQVCFGVIKAFSCAQVLSILCWPIGPSEWKGAVQFWQWLLLRWDRCCGSYGKRQWQLHCLRNEIWFPGHSGQEESALTSEWLTVHRQGSLPSRTSQSLGGQGGGSSVGFSCAKNLWVWRRLQNQLVLMVGSLILCLMKTFDISVDVYYIQYVYYWTYFAYYKF